jgi:hypothetical protein
MKKHNQANETGASITSLAGSLANGVSLICQGEQPAYVPGDCAYTEMYDGSNGPLVCLYELKQKEGN